MTTTDDIVARLETLGPDMHGPYKEAMFDARDTIDRQAAEIDTLRTEVGTLTKIVAAQLPNTSSA